MKLKNNPMAKSFKDLDIKSIAKQSAEETDEKLASKISSITRLKDEEITKLFPIKGDVAKLAALMQIVTSAEKRNIKENQIVENAEKFAGIIITLLSKMI
jgi:hypothetical protein